jgi:nucleotide-binding universal stress UspA family protein
MFRRILVPVDGTAGSEQAVACACGLAKALDAEVLVCHVIGEAAGTRASGQAPDAAQYVTKIAQRFRDEGVPARTQVRRGAPALEIKAAAVEWNVDLIVMATRSRRRLEKLMLGSVADAVVRESHLPVLLVSSRRRAAKRSEAAA